MGKPNKKSKTMLDNLKKMRELETVYVVFSDETEADCDILCNFDLAGDMLCVLFTRGEKLENGLLKTYGVFYDPKTDEVVLDNEMEEDELQMIRQVMDQNLVKEDEENSPLCYLSVDEVEEVQFVL